MWEWFGFVFKLPPPSQPQKQLPERKTQLRRRVHTEPRRLWSCALSPNLAAFRALRSGTNRTLSPRFLSWPPSPAGSPG